MSENIIILALAILPVLILSIYIYRKDKFEKEPLGMLVKAFLFGCLSVIPAVVLEKFLMAVAPLSVSESYSDVWQSIYNGFVVAGFSEELCKLLLLAFVVWRSRHFNEYFDGIVYAVFLSLGFAGVENLLYVFGQETMMLSMTTAVVRAAVSVPGHFLFAVAMGYYLALAKFEPAKRLLNLIKAFLVPVMLHGAFDTLLMLSSAMSDYATEISRGLLFLFVFFDIKLWKAGKRKLRRLQMKSEIQNYENLTDIETE